MQVEPFSRDQNIFYNFNPVGRISRAQPPPLKENINSFISCLVLFWVKTSDRINNLTRHSLGGEETGIGVFHGVRGGLSLNL